MEKIKLMKTKYGPFFVMKNDLIGRHFFRGRWYEDRIINILKKYIKPNTNVLDIGANIGVHTIPYAKKDSSIIVHSFEPQSFIFNNLLKKNVQINKLNNVKLYNNAVGHENIKTHMSKFDQKGNLLNYNNNKVFNFGGQKIGLDGEEVNMISIDSLNIKNISLVKIDVEGFEKLVIYGMRETLKREKPVIFYEELYNIKNIKTDIKIDKKIFKFNITNFLKDELNYKIFKKIGHNILCLPN